MKISEIENLSKEQLLKNLNDKRRREFLDAALSAIHRLVQSKGSKQSIGSYAYDIARSFDSGYTGRQLADLYKEKYKVTEASDVTEITDAQLKKLEFYLDQLFSKIGIDVEFTKHFLDRANDERNIKQITLKELAELFRDTYVKYGKKIAKMGPDAQAVIKDMRTDINVPFVLNWDRRNQELDLVAKTVMRKKNFRTPNQELPLK